MIDWPNLFFNSLWILACALALANLSQTSYEASQSRRRWRTILGEPGPQMAFNLAGMLFCAGLSGTSNTIWERVLWAALGVAFLVQVVLPLVQHFRKPQDSIKETGQR